MTIRKSVVAVLGLLVATSALIAAGCGGSSSSSGGAPEGAPTALPSSSCGPIQYDGEGDAQLLITSDLPLQGSSRSQTIQIQDAIKYTLGQQDWKAGDFNVAYQSCDDSTAQAAKWDSGKCSQNANAYAANDHVIGVIGTFNSGCAAIIIPVLNQAADGGVAMLSPANTAVCLTTTAGSCSSTEPDQYYPSGERNYARVVAHDAFQGAALAEFMQTKGVKSLYILNDKETYGLGIAQNLRDSAESLGINIAGFEAWDGKASSYEAIFQKIGQTDADAVFLGGLIDENGAQVIKDKVAVLGPNNGKVALYAPDGFATQATIDEAGTASQDMWMSVAGTPIDAYSGAAQEFVTGFTDQFLDANTPIDPYAVFGAQAAVVMLDAIAASDGSRADIIKQMLDTSISDGYLGSFSFNENGDPQDASGTIVQFTIYRATTKLETETTITPQQSTVDAALQSSSGGDTTSTG